ncbi:MAG: phosphoribosyltransferase [Turicibacter sp.]
MLFRDRLDAGRLLCDHLAKYKDDDVLVLLVPRGGMEIGMPAIKRFNFAWDLIIPRKIGAPHHKEIAIGAVTVDGNYLLNEEYVKYLGVSDAYIQQETTQEMAEIKRRLTTYRQSDEFPDVCDKIVILVDDGIATGFTLLAAIKSIKQHHPAKVILAIPVGPTDIIEEIRQFVDDVICLHSVTQFTSVGAYYHWFEQVSDDEMMRFIDTLNQYNIH